MTNDVRIPAFFGRHEDVRVLAWFLNLDIKKGLKLRKEIVKLFSPARVVSKDPAAKRIQAELRQILIPLTNPKKTPSLQEADSLIEKLVKKINQNAMKPYLHILRMEFDANMESNSESGNLKSKKGWPRGKVDRRMKSPEELQYPVTWQGVLKMPTITLNGKTEVVAWRFAPVQFLSDRVERYYYPIIGDVLQSGELLYLRSCPECQKFFVAEDLRREFCSDQCRNDYNNRQRLEAGYFSELRRKKRQRELGEARRLSKKGKSPEEVVSAIPGLTIRILRREGLAPKK